MLYTATAKLYMGHSMSNQHAKLTPVTDFAETC